VAAPLDDLRAVVAGTAAAPLAMTYYLEKVATRAYTVTDADVDALVAAGLSEDEVFEQTVATAIGQGLRRLELATAVIG
jgi:alkylhydroperoxidase family enzyme